MLLHSIHQDEERVPSPPIRFTSSTTAAKQLSLQNTVIKDLRQLDAADAFKEVTSVTARKIFLSTRISHTRQSSPFRRNIAVQHCETIGVIAHFGGQQRMDIKDVDGSCTR